MYICIGSTQRHSILFLVKRELVENKVYGVKNKEQVSCCVFPQISGT